MQMLAPVTTQNVDPKSADAADPAFGLEQAHIRLEKAMTSSEVARILVEAGLTAARATGGAVVVLDDDRRCLQVAFSVGGQSERIARGTQLSLMARFPLSEVVRTREELWLNSPDELARLYPEAQPLDNSSAWAVLPLFVDGVILGAVGWSFQRPWFTPWLRASLRRLARAGGAALYRAGLFDSERLARMQAELARFEAERRDLMMAGIASVLDAPAAMLHPARHFEKVARRALPLLGDWCAFQVVGKDGRLRQVASAHVTRAHERSLRATYDQAQQQSGRKLPAVLNSDRPLFIPNIGIGNSRDSGLPPAQLRALQSIGLERLLVVPLRVHRHTLGTVCFASPAAVPAYGAGDQRLAQRVARRCAALLHHAGLHDAAVQANIAREEFVASTSHELRTPLSHIKGFVSTLRTTDTEWDPATRDDFLAEIEQEADRLARLVENLLDMSRIDSGGVRSCRSGADAPATLVMAGIDRVRASLGSHRLEVQAPLDLPPVRVDASQVERVIANLLENAAKYSPPDESIVVSARRSQRMVMFRIEDRGLGIPSEHLERIFEPFFREPTGPYPAKPGTGLGLAICRTIVRAHGGEIWAEQRPGGGAALVFTLPIASRKRR